MLPIELRRYAKFQVHIFKTDSGKKARRGAGSCLILPIVSKEYLERIDIIPPYGHISPAERRAARMLVLHAEYAERGFRAEMRGLCADSVSSLVRSQLCAIPRHSAPYGARICASGRGFRRGFERGFYF